MTAFPHLFQPLDLGTMRLANRIVTGSMHTRLETLDRPLERIARFKRPKRYVYVDELPKNSYGKVLKRELRELV